MQIEQKFPIPAPDAVPVSTNTPVRLDTRLLPHRTWSDGEQRYPQLFTIRPVDEEARRSIEALVHQTVTLEETISQSPLPEPSVQTLANPYTVAGPTIENVASGPANTAPEVLAQQPDPDAESEPIMQQQSPSIEPMPALTPPQAALPAADRTRQLQQVEKSSQRLSQRIDTLESQASHISQNIGASKRYQGVRAAMKRHKVALLTSRISDLKSVRQQVEQGLAPSRIPVRTRSGRLFKHAAGSTVLAGAHVYETTVDRINNRRELRAQQLRERAATRIKPMALPLTPAYYSQQQAQSKLKKAELLEKRAVTSRENAAQRRQRLYASSGASSVSNNSPWAAPDAAMRQPAVPKHVNAWVPPIAPSNNAPPAQQPNQNSKVNAPKPIDEHDPAVRVKLNLVVGRMTAPGSAEQQEWASRKQEFLDQGGEESSPEFQELRETWSQELHQRALNEVSQNL